MDFDGFMCIYIWYIIRFYDLVDVKMSERLVELKLRRTSDIKYLYVGDILQDGTCMYEVIKIEGRNDPDNSTIIGKKVCESDTDCDFIRYVEGDA